MGAVVVDMFLVSCGFDRLTKFKASVGLYGIEQLFTHLFHTVKGGSFSRLVQVLAVGRRSMSPAFWMKNGGSRSC